MVRVLINESNNIVDIAKVGEEFEVHTSLTWVDCLSEVTREGSWELQEDGTAIDTSLVSARTPEGKHARFNKARSVAYGEIGEQLGMLYNDLKNGTTNWVDKIDQIKLDIPKVGKPADALVATDYIPPVEI